MEVTPEGVLQLSSPRQGVLWASNEGNDLTVADTSTPEVETPEAVAEDPAPAGDVRTIGGVYTTTYPPDGGGVEGFFIFPEGTQSDPNATFIVTYEQENEIDFEETLTGTYNHPSLNLGDDDDDNWVIWRCTVADDVDSIDCYLTWSDYGLLTFTRQ